MDEDDYIEVESPLEHPVDAEDDEIDELILQSGQVAGEERNGVNAEEKVGSPEENQNSDPRKNICMDKPIFYPIKPKDRKKLLQYPKSLPYQCESLEEFDARLEHIYQRIIAAIETRDFYGFPIWNHHLSCLLSLKYPIELTTLARLARVYYHLSVLPGVPTVVHQAVYTCITLLGGRKKITIAHLVLPWRPLYNMLKRELFVKERKTNQTNISNSLLDLALSAQRLFDPEEADEMLREMLPNLDGSDIDSMIATLSLLVHFLPTSHPQRWLPTLFRLWESFSSSLFDEQMLDLCARLAEQHVEDPRISSTKALEEVGLFADIKADSLKSKSNIRTNGHGKQSPSIMTSEEGLWNDVGIFTEYQFSFIMTKCLRSAGLPVGSSKVGNAALMAQSSTLLSGADSVASAGVLNMKKPSEPSHSFATIIVYSMMRDSQSPTSSGSATPVENGMPAQPTEEKRGTHLAGSKALSSLARFIQATESYFHPSNWGVWALQLSSQVKNLTWEFSKRWKEEQKSECKTPKAFRLTPEIKREFTATLRTVCLLSMFSKDPATIAASQSSLKRLAILEPEQIIPSVLERAYSSLEALETTHRTLSVITALSTLGVPLVSREIFKAGGKHLVPILHLCLPGIDMNDYMKTIGTSILIVVTSTVIKIDDLTRPELASSSKMAIDDYGGGAPQEEEEEFDEEDDALRLSTAGFEDWTVSFFNRVLVLFDALPEEGKNGRAGRIEEQMTSTLLAACDAVCCSMSDHLFDINFKIVADHVMTHVCPQATRVTGSLISCFARHDPKKVTERLVRPCTKMIRQEIEQGASSIRTTKTTQAAAGDVNFHWYISILIGSLTFSGEEIFAFKDELMDLMMLLCDRTKSERGYFYAAMLVQRVLNLLVNTYPNDHRFVNPDEWEKEDMQAKSYKYWGKMYVFKDVKIQWHVPSDAEIALALEILDRVVHPRLSALEKLQEDGAVRDKVWSNDFCRNMASVRLAFSAVNTMILEKHLGEGGQALEYLVDGYEDFIRTPDRFKSGILLTDPNDERYIKVKAFKVRFGELLHLSAQTMHNSGAEDQIDCVRLMLRSIRTYMTSYGYNPDDHKAYSISEMFYQNMAAMYPRQKVFPRMFWVRRAAHYNSSRGRLNGFYRRRSPLDDLLINDVVQLTMSNYVAIRKTAQSTFDALTSYNQIGELTVHNLLSVIQNSTNDDQIKGALYMVGSKYMGQIPRHPAFTEKYLMTLLNAQHHSKPSIQKLLRSIINHTQARLPEISAIVHRIKVPELEEALSILGKGDGFDDLIVAPSKQKLYLDDWYEKMSQSFVTNLLEYAQQPKTHWNFEIFALRLIKTFIRKDQPLRADVATYLTRQMINENPMIRRASQVAITKILYYTKLQTLCKTDEELVLGSCKPEHHPLKRVEPISQITDEWKQERLASYRSDQAITSSTKFHDKEVQGWLVWSDKETYYLAPPESGTVFDWVNKSVLEAISNQLTTDHWKQILKHYAQEKEREQLSRETTVLIRSIFQVFGLPQLELVKDQLVEFVGERDRHKHRAAAEIIAGMFRGAKHWNRQDAKVMWSWLDTILPKILAECTPDSQVAWQDSIEYILQQRDPRRAMSLVNLVVKKAKDTLSTEDESPWEQVQAQKFLRGVILSLNMKMYPWMDELNALFRSNFETQFDKVRELIACNMTDLEMLRVAPSFGSVDQLLDVMYEETYVKKTHGSIFAEETLIREYSARLTKLDVLLTDLKKERKPKSQGTSRYDLLALTTLCWIAESLGDHRRTAMRTCVIDFIPTIFQCCNLQDNADLSGKARSVLIATVSTMAHYDIKLVKKLIRKVSQVIEESDESWRARLDALPVLQILFWQNIFNMDEEIFGDITQTLLNLLTDPHLEVRNLASTTLSGIIRCSQKELIQSLRKRFRDQVIKFDRLPKRGSEGFQEIMTGLHAGILGCIALISAFPYSVPKWMPALICDTMTRHQDSPDPVGPACKKMAADFKRTHQDTWEEDKAAFSSDQLAEYLEWGGRTDYYA